MKCDPVIIASVTFEKWRVASFLMEVR